MTALTGEARLRKALKGGRRVFVTAIAFSFLCNLLRLTGPIFILLIYDRVLSSGSTETLVVLFSLVVAFLATMAMLDYARRRLLARYGAQLQERVEEQIFLTTPKEGFLKTNQVKPAAGLSDIDVIRGFFHSSAVIAVLDVFWAPMFLAVIFLFHWILGIVATVGIALLWILYRVKRASSAERSGHAKLASRRIGDLKTMITKSRHELKSQAMTSSFNDLWINARKESRDGSIALKDWTAWFQIISGQIKKILQYSVLAVGAVLTLRGDITVGAMIASMFLSVRVFTPVDQFLREQPAIRRAARCWEFLKKSFEDRVAPHEHRELWHLEPGLTLANVSKRSPRTNQLILRAINLTAEAGSTVEIVGDSGAGKTALAETILGATPKVAGIISCGGADVERLTIEQADRIFAYIPEIVRLIDGTLAENISGLEEAPDFDRIIEASRVAGIHDTILTLPDGYESEIRAEDDGLSNGDRRKIALARALYRDASILLIDEPDEHLAALLATDLRQHLRNKDAVIVVFSRESVPGLEAAGKYRLEAGRLRQNKSASVVPIEKRQKKTKNSAGD